MAVEDSGSRRGARAKCAPTVTSAADGSRASGAVPHEPGKWSIENIEIGIPQLVEDALRINAEELLRHGVTIQREFEAVPPVRADQHKVLQILVNLLRNADDALNAAAPGERILSLRICRNGDDRVRILVRDTGIGIASENLIRLFGHGFTTKRDGHGFGLHSGAVAAKEMGGALRAASEGLGRGATFTLDKSAAWPMKPS